MGVAVIFHVQALKKQQQQMDVVTNFISAVLPKFIV